MSSDLQTRTAVSADGRRGAVFDADREYRYRLWRTWDGGKPTVAFVMLNPSTADAANDDPTVRRCVNYADDWGYGTLEVVNLFALRATDPSALRDHPDPVGGANDDFLRTVTDAAATVVAAWGAKGTLHGRGLEVARDLETPFHALDTTTDGHPVHPLYQPAEATLDPWDERSLEAGGPRR